MSHPEEIPEGGNNVGITMSTLRKILAVENPGDGLALYTFYAYTSRWQNAKDSKCTIAYAAKGLGWTEERVRKAKKALMEKGLVEECRKTDKQTNRVVGWYVKVKALDKSTLRKNHTVEMKVHPPVFPDCGLNHTVENHYPNATVVELSATRVEEIKDSNESCDGVVEEDSKGTEHKQFIEDWCGYYEKKFKDKYPFNGRDAKAVKTLLRHFGSPEKAKEFIKSCHAKISTYPFNNTTTLYDLANNLPRLIAALNNPPQTQKEKKLNGEYRNPTRPPVFDPTRDVQLPRTGTAG